MTQFRKLFLRKSSSAIEALKVIDEGACQISLVVDDEEHLVGTLTDGDIRRGLLMGKSLDSSVVEFMKSNHNFININQSKDVAFKIMRRLRINQIPVLDDKGKVVDLILRSDFLVDSLALPNVVVVMAGGKGTRLRPYTENCPKPMLQVGDKPMLEILLQQAISSGFTKFYFSVNYLKEQIIDYFDDGGSWGVDIKYLIEEKPLGTAGSLQYLPSGLTDPFLVINGDVLTNFSYSKLIQFHHEHQSVATICVREHEVKLPFGVVQTSNFELESFKEKPTYRDLVNAGVYVIDPILLPLLSPNEFIDMPTLLINAKNQGNRVSVCPIHEYWLDVGRPETLKEAHVKWEGISHD
tara:strand:- start:10625 stop:11680 length:1056 start_codon:yes stop_codon:yes gene_type:complete